MNASLRCHRAIISDSLGRKRSLIYFRRSQVNKTPILLIKEFIRNKTSCNVLLTYEIVVKTKKQCYPEKISISESKVEVDLQVIGSHIIVELLMYLETVIRDLQAAVFISYLVCLIKQ